MTLKRTLFACSLLLGAVGCGASAPDLASGSDSGNSCELDSDCGNGRCTSGRCVASGNTIEYVMVEISPPVGVGSGEYGDVRYLLPRRLGSDHVLDFALDVVAELSVAVSPPQADCAAVGVDDEGHLPIAVKAYVDNGIHGIDSSIVEASSAQSVGTSAKSNTVTVSLPPGLVDLYLLPLAEGRTSDATGDPDGHCDLAPLLARGQTIAPGVVSMKQPMPPVDHVNVDVVAPVGTDGQSLLEGWTIDMVEPLGGKRLSTRALLSNATSDANGRLHYDIRLAYHPIVGLDADKLDGAELFRVAPPTDVLAPTYYVARSAMDLFDASKVVLSQIDSVSSPVVMSGFVESNVDGSPVRADIVATLSSQDAGVSGALAHYQVTTSTDAAGKFELRLLAGKYRIVAIPAASSPYAAWSGEWTVAASPVEQAGKLILVGPMHTLTGVAYSAMRRETLAGVTLSASPSSLGKRPTFLDELLGKGEPVGVRSQTVVADARGVFEIPVDEGRYDVSVRPAEGTGYPWGVRPSVGAGSAATEPLYLELPNPVAYSGTVTAHGSDPGGAAGVLPGALLRFYALFDESGQLADSSVPAVSSVEIGHARADEAGTYRVLLPEGID